MDNLTWDAHARSLRTKLCKAVYMPKILKETMGHYIRNIYYSNFHPCLRYDIISWGGDNGSNTIFKLQRKVIRITSGVSNHTSYNQTFKDCNILTQSSLYILEVICSIKI
jgi:hypothetical protein